jgi:hypothetical protein
MFRDEQAKFRQEDLHYARRLLNVSCCFFKRGPLSKMTDAQRPNSAKFPSGRTASHTG